MRSCFDGASEAGLMTGGGLSESSVRVDEGDSVLWTDCGAGVPSRSIRMDSASLVAAVPLLIWFCVSLSSSLWSNISVSSESVSTSVPSPSRMIRPFLPPNPLLRFSRSSSYSSGLS